MDVVLTTSVVKPTRRVFTSGCGMGLTFTLRISHYAPLSDDLCLAPEDIFPLMQQMFDGAVMYNASRGIHAAALSDTQQVLLLAEDVGRHNALDKILGEALLNDIPTAGRLLLTSGRISSEMLRKARTWGHRFSSRGRPRRRCPLRLPNVSGSRSSAMSGARVLMSIPTPNGCCTDTPPRRHRCRADHRPRAVCHYMRQIPDTLRT